jgi:hypothetical protein
MKAIRSTSLPVYNFSTEEVSMVDSKRDPAAKDPANYRTPYSEEDIQELTSDPRFLVAVDAYGSDLCSMDQMVRLAFAEPPYVPRGLDAMTFVDLVLEVVRRIHSGELRVREEWKKQYADFYVSRPPVLD